MSIINKVYEKIRVKIYQYLFIKNFQTYDEADIFCSRYFSNCYNNNYLNEYRFQKFKLNFNDLPFLNHHGSGKEPENFKKKLVLFPHTVIEENLLKNIFASSYKLIREGKGINAGLSEKEYSKDLIFERVYNDSI